MIQADAVLAIAGLRADAAEVYVEETDLTVVEFRAGRLLSQQTRLECGCGLRVFKDGRLGFASSTDDERCDELVDAALESAALGDQDRGRFAGPAALPAVTTGNSRVMLHPAGRFVDWGNELCAAMRARIPELKLDLTFTRTRSEIRVATTAGADAAFERVTLDLRASGLIAGTGGIFWLPGYVNLSDGRHPDFSPLCDRLESAARQGRLRAKAGPSEQPVIVAPFALPALLAPLATGVNGRQAQQRTSPLLGREGETVIAECLSVTDNPLRPHALAGAPMDGEGVVTRAVPLFEQGRFRGFLHNIDSAAACGVESTGSARRDYRSLPAPGLSNLEIAPGDCGIEEALRRTGSGLLVNWFVGGGQSNLLAGSVALNATSAFRFEKGEIIGRVKDVIIAGNAYEMLASVDLVGDETQDLGRWFLPWLRFPSLRVTARD